MADVKELFGGRLIASPEEVRTKALGYSKNKMYELLENDKTFPAFRINGGTKWGINVSKLQDWIDAQTNKR